jgi:hypothetical protein
MENVRERVDIRLVGDDRKLKKLVAKPSFKRFKIFNEDLVGVEMKRVTIELNRPAYLGAQILDISKNLMTTFHYEVMKQKYGDQIELLFTDTDSLCYEITTDDVYEDMKNFQDCFDTSNYDKDHPLYCDKNKKVPGKFKDELGGVYQFFFFKRTMIRILELKFSYINLIIIISSLPLRPFSLIQC